MSELQVLRAAQCARLPWEIGEPNLRELHDSVLPLSAATSPEYLAPAKDVLRDNLRFEREARRVGELQCSLLPQPLPLPRITGLEIAVSYQPCGHAGGDLYDFFPLDERALSRQWCIFVADACCGGGNVSLVNPTSARRIRPVAARKQLGRVQ